MLMDERWRSRSMQLDENQLATMIIDVLAAFTADERLIQNLHGMTPEEARAASISHTRQMLQKIWKVSGPVTLLPPTLAIPATRAPEPESQATRITDAAVQ